MDGKRKRERGAAAEAGAGAPEAKKAAVDKATAAPAEAKCADTTSQAHCKCGRLVLPVMWREQAARMATAAAAADAECGGWVND